MFVQEFKRVGGGGNVCKGKPKRGLRWCLANRRALAVNVTVGTEEEKRFHAELRPLGLELNSRADVSSRWDGAAAYAAPLVL